MRFSAVSLVTATALSAMMSTASAQNTAIPAIAYGETLEAAFAEGDALAFGSAGICEVDFYADSFAFEGAAGDEIRVVMTSSDIPPVLSLYHPADYFPVGEYGPIQNSDLDSETEAVIVRALPVTGSYRIETTSREICAPGAYRLFLERTGVDAELAANPAVSFATRAALARLSIAYGETLSGRLEQTDLLDALGNPFDEYGFTGQAGDVVRVRARAAGFEATASFYQVGPTDLLHYEQGNPDDETGDPDAEFTYTLPADGSYMIEVGSYFGLESGDYEVTLERLP
jgi:hypothetical protein